MESTSRSMICRIRTGCCEACPESVLQLLFHASFASPPSSGAAEAEARRTVRCVWRGDSLVFRWMCTFQQRQHCHACLVVFMILVSDSSTPLQWSRYRRLWYVTPAQRSGVGPGRSESDTRGASKEQQSPPSLSRSHSPAPLPKVDIDGEGQRGSRAVVRLSCCRLHLYQQALYELLLQHHGVTDECKSEKQRGRRGCCWLWQQRAAPTAAAAPTAGVRRWNRPASRALQQSSWWCRPGHRYDRQERQALLPSFAQAVGRTWNDDQLRATTIRIDHTHSLGLALHERLGDFW